MLSQLFLKIAYGGSEWVLWLLVLLSFVSIAVIADRIFFFRRHKVDAASLESQLSEFLTAGNFQAAWQLVSSSPAIECIVVAAGLAAMRNGANACNESMLAAKAQERKGLDGGLAILGTIGSNAPFVGLLGTVLGIIKAAGELTDAAGASAVMTGVFEALVATAVGLFVAIPAVVAYNVFAKKVKTTMIQVDAFSHLVLANIRTESRAKSPPSLQPQKVS